MVNLGSSNPLDVDTTLRTAEASVAVPPRVVEPETFKAVNVPTAVMAANAPEVRLLLVTPDTTRSPALFASPEPTNCRYLLRLDAIKLSS